MYLTQISHGLIELSDLLSRSASLALKEELYLGLMQLSREYTVSHVPPSSPDTSS